MSSINQEDLSKFIHALSHDLKNILHNIQGYVNLLEDENNPEFLSGIVMLVGKAKNVIDQYVVMADEGNLEKYPITKRNQ